MHHIIDDGKVIRVEGKGFYAEDELRRHFGALSRLVARRRQSMRPVLAMIDLREAATQSASVAGIMALETNRIYSGSTDRVAIIVSSMLLKMQLERVHKQQGFGIFTSLDEASLFLDVAASAMIS